MTQLLYLEDSYLKEASAKVKKLNKKGGVWQLTLDRTIFYAQGGGQTSDIGWIIGHRGKFIVENVRMDQAEAVHTGKLEGDLRVGEIVELRLDWDRRFRHMQLHSAGHVIHEVVMKLIPGLTPIKAEHGENGFIKYQGMINPKLAPTIETQSNMLVAEDREITSRFVTFEELKTQASWVPPHLPENKPLRIIQIEGYPPMPDGGTQVASTAEVGTIINVEVETANDVSTVYYQLVKTEVKPAHVSESKPTQIKFEMTLNNFQTLLLELEKELLNQIDQAKPQELEPLKIKYFGKSGQATQIIKQLKNLPPDERKKGGLLVNAFKKTVGETFVKQSSRHPESKTDWFDVTLPGIKPPQGHLHIVTQAIIEITRIFERIGFIRVRHPEVDWDWYAFESLNMPPDHPARDEWETFFIENQNAKIKMQNDSKYTNMVLTPHTSNGQVREMEKGLLPIRMINIAKCYRRQSDISHTPMFHQFEGMYIDKNVSISHLKGVFDYFVKHFYGPDRQIRLRPFHFQFTEPSFEVDITCDLCGGTGKLSGQKCRLCKAGWLEMAGSGMIHPAVLKNGGIDPEKYSGFAFGWGIERAYMMKAGLKIDDLRIIYSNDIRFLNQF